MMRIDKYLGITGCCSRADAKRAIRAGSVAVNGVAVTEGVQVDGNVVTYVLKAITEDSAIVVTLVSRSYTIYFLYSYWIL